ncbi:MAG TPA: hypothetical protein VHE09_03475 [Rhizomicrobium sp.]|nr:hypothetical protein [Rhizomicrobium sp.]
MQTGWWIGAIFDVMLVAGVVSAAIAIGMLIDTVLLSLDWVLARVYPQTTPAFAGPPMDNTAQVIRLRISQFYILAAGLGTPAMIWVGTAFNGPPHGPALKDIYFGGLTLIVIWLVGASHAYEFYAIRPEAERKVWSFDYARLFVFNLALPVLFWFLFAMGQQVGFVDYANKHLFRAQPSALLVLQRESSRCELLLEHAGLRARHNDVAQGGGVLDPLPWIDEYLSGVTFGVPEAFGCSFNDVRFNPGNPAMDAAVTLFRTIVSFFSISVLLLPLQRLWRFTVGIAAKAPG